ncbi:hypothetical protein S40293_09728 [Stachybotrys chartarum IBT 40293]|nr:hypothetical protein S40293_09728 [Stachybotrys chartarum IBT 40293]
MPVKISLPFIATWFLASCVMAAPQNTARQPAPELSITAQLQLAATGPDRYQILQNNEDFIFDFAEAPIANRQSFPALQGTGGSLVQGYMPPCSMSAVHIHPRATELFTVVTGRIHTQMVPEFGVVDASNSQRVIRTELGPGMMTVFPLGAFHTAVNLDCSNATFVAAFTSEESGISLVASQLFALSDETIDATFGHSITGDNIGRIRSAIPAGVNLVIEECLSRCDSQ